jgi:response regulator RpfG family c-di-GMP phosphodiesterase/GGDEF domain-containing protein
MVDDRPENLLALESVLEPLGGELVRAGSGEEALKRVLAEDFAVILLDVHMPGMDGFETAAYLKRLERTRSVPIIFLTAISKHPSSVFRGYEAGAVDYLSKPFDPDVLRSKVAVLLDLHEQRVALQALAAQQAALRRVATAIAGDEQPGQVFTMVAEEVAKLFDVDAGVVARADDEGQFVILGAWPRHDATGAPSERRSSDSVMSAVLRSGSPERGRVEATGQTGGGEQIVAPIRLGAQLWGVVAVIAGQSDAFPPDAEQQLVEFADLLGLALAGADSRRLAAQASRDPLTGLANHRTFQERLRVEVQRAQRHGRNLALALLGVDGFKAVNDTLGHQAGDRVLLAVAARLADTLRSSDLVARTSPASSAADGADADHLVARVGGDEFALLLPETDALAAQAVAERARLRIGSEPLAPGHAVTISIGVCDLTQAEDVDELIRFADGALYWAKEHGRNTVCNYSPQGVEELSAQERAERLARNQVLHGIRALARAVDAKDHSTQEHSDRVSNLAGLLAEGLGWPPDRVALLRESALVHDVGKIGVPDAILLKAGPLNAEEYAVVKGHAALGAQIASGVLNEEQTAWVRSHHERYDATGYPDGLSGDVIPEGAHLMAVADAWDVMTSDRPYSPRMQPLDALAECRRQAGTQFAPAAVAALETPAFLRVTQIGENEFAARAVNEHRDLRDESPADTFEIVCECGDACCREPITVGQEEYASGRAHQRRFLVTPGHEIPDAERVISETDRFRVVEKRL